MAKRESDYDLQPELKAHLLTLHSEAFEFSKSYLCESSECQYDNVVYLRNIHDLCTGIDEGLESVYKMQKYKIKEQKKLRANTKNYIKKYFSDGLLKKIECFVDGKSDGCFMAVYKENKRYLIPVSEKGEYYGTYTHVLETYEDYYLEYMVNNVQIVYRKYAKLSDTKYAYTCINYIIEGQYPINGIDAGIIDTTTSISYSGEFDFCWYEEFDAKRKNIPYCVADNPFIVKIPK